MLLPFAFLAIAGLIFTGCSVAKVSGGPGGPVGDSIRLSTHIATLISTEQDHPPALQPNQIQAYPRKVALLLTPLDQSPPPPLLEITTNAPADLRLIRFLAADGDQVWIAAGTTYHFNLSTRSIAPVSSAPNPSKLPNWRDFLHAGKLYDNSHWLGFSVPEEVSAGKLKPGAPAFPNLIPLGRTPQLPLRDGEVGKADRKRLFRIALDRSAPIVRFAAATEMDPRVFRNAATIPAPDNPDHLIALYEESYPNDTLNVMRLDPDGKRLWSTDTRIAREPQLLVGSGTLAIRGTPRAAPGKFPQPIMVLLNTTTGSATVTELRW